MTCGVYEIWCGPYFYQGSSKNIDFRVKAHLSLLRKGKHENSKFQGVYDKYGWSSFAVLIECEEHALAVWEQQYLDANFGNDNFINLNPSAYRLVHTPEMIEKIRAAATGRKHTDETKAKVAAAQLGVKRGPYSPERVQAAADGQRGRKLTEEHKEKLRQINLGVKRGPHSDEAKAKIAASNTGKTHSPETLAKLRAAKLGKPGNARDAASRARSAAALTAYYERKRAEKVPTVTVLDLFGEGEN